MRVLSFCVPSMETAGTTSTSRPSARRSICTSINAVKRAKKSARSILRSGATSGISKNASRSSQRTPFGVCLRPLQEKEYVFDSFPPDSKDSVANHRVNRGFRRVLAGRLDSVVLSLAQHPGRDQLALQLHPGGFPHSLHRLGARNPQRNAQPRPDSRVSLFRSEPNALRSLADTKTLQRIILRGEPALSSDDAGRETALVSDVQQSEQGAAARSSAAVDELAGAARRRRRTGLEGVAGAAELAADQPAAGAVYVCVLAGARDSEEFVFGPHCGGGGERTEVDCGGRRWEKRTRACGNRLAAARSVVHSVPLLWVFLWVDCDAQIVL